jgi:hypothetical protein
MPVHAEWVGVSTHSEPGIKRRWAVNTELRSPGNHYIAGWGPRGRSVRREISPLQAFDPRHYVRIKGNILIKLICF